MFKTLLSATAALAVLHGAALAQFAGDVFLEVPSQAADIGEAVTFDVLTFAGANAVGAVSFDLLYDPAVLEVISVEAGAEQPLGDEIASDDAPGRLSLVAVNGTELAGPIGTVELARVTVRPKAGAGASTQLAIAVEEMLTTGGAWFSRTRGYGGSVYVRQDASAFAPAADPSGEELRAAALAMRPGGATVEIATPGGMVAVSTADDSGPADVIEE